MGDAGKITSAHEDHKHSTKYFYLTFFFYFLILQTWPTNQACSVFYHLFYCLNIYIVIHVKLNMENVVKYKLGQLQLVLIT